MKKIIILAAVLLPAISAFASELTTDDLIVSNNATIYGNLNFYTVAGGTTNGATASGGDITLSGGYRIHTFTNSGTFTISGGSLTCDVLVAAGGGAGGSHRGGGGGGGGVLVISNLLVSGSNTVTVGGGGGANPVVNAEGSNGFNSVFGTNTATGGGGGAAYAGGLNNGGSGGGGSEEYGPGTGSPGQGNNGGADSSGKYLGGGGGGGGAAGQAATATPDSAGDGGIGKVSGISGSSVYYGGGGGGGSRTNYSDFGIGGTGGGGNGGYLNAGSAGTANTGGGGGGGGELQSGGNGGSGIVIVRYPYTGDSNVIALTVSSNGINQASASGVNKFMGKVGIGTDNPAEKLHVAGNVQVDGSMKLGGETRTNWPNVAVGALIASNNLSDVTDPATARSNLGLGSAATNEASVFLTLTSDGSQLTNITAAQVGALSTNAGVLIAANNLSDLANASVARTNLGLGSAAINDASAFLSTTGGVVNGNVNINGSASGDAPSGDVPMGVYTNQ